MQNIVFPKRRINGKLQIFLRVKPYECTIDTFFFWNCQLPIKVIYRNRNYICFFCTNPTHRTMLHIDIFKQNHILIVVFIIPTDRTFTCEVFFLLFLKTLW